MPSVKIETDAENGDYLTVSGRFLMCFLEQRIIYPTCSFTSQKSYSDIVHSVVSKNAISDNNRRIPGFSLGSVIGDCWGQTTKLQVSYDNLMEWIYTICEKIGGTANIRLKKINGEQYKMILDLSEGTDRSIMQNDNPHIIFSDGYTNLLSFTYSSDISAQRNFAYVLGKGEGAERKRTTYFDGDEPSFLERYEVYVDTSPGCTALHLHSKRIPQMTSNPAIRSGLHIGHSRLITAVLTAFGNIPLTAK